MNVPPPPAFDEARDPAGHPRPHWADVLRTVPDVGGDEFARRWRDAGRLIRDNGVTYNAYGDPDGAARPWRLDPLPLVIPPGEADALERGLVQRATLFELILADLYGPQRLLHDGLVPPELVFANPGFLRPLHGVRPPLGRYLHLYAANLGRDADGRWRVTGDRTQAPSGAGYALENRIVIARTFPEAFAACRVQRLALFFQTLISSLRAAAPRPTHAPRVVLLTPGPFNETYFEHSYLARYLGWTLVEGGDLTVRDGAVYLKVLGGLQRVDVIFRRLDDAFCDPLELRPDSTLGVPGLVQAVRSGNVAVVNALGSGLLETPWLNAHLPRLCRALLGEDLRLTPVRTWWCGDPDARTYVLDHLTDVVVKPAFAAVRTQPVVVGGECDAAALGELADRIRANPRGFVGQEVLPLSAVPVAESGVNGGSRKMVFRAYLAAERDSFTMMPGGLTRIGARPQDSAVSMQQGGGSKDTWVLSAGPVSTFSLLPPADRPVAIDRGGGELPSRVADDLYWFGRYAERVESTARLLRGVLTRLAEGVPAAPLLRAVPRPGGRPEFDGDPTAEALAAVFDPTRGGSVAAAVREAHRLGGLVRDRMSEDLWRVVGRFSRDARPPDRPTAADALDALDRLIFDAAAFGGLAADGMTRGDGWRFLDLGRRIERAVHLAALVAGALVVPAADETATFDAVLDVADSRISYRRRYLGGLRAEAVLDLLLLDGSNPRGLAAQLTAAADDVDRLPRPAGTADPSAEQTLARSLLALVREADAATLARLDGGARHALRELLANVGGRLRELSDVLTRQYLTHLQTSRHLAPGPAA